MKNIIIYLILIMVLVTSCFKEDDPIPSSPEKETTIELNQYYQFRSYFDMGAGEEVVSYDRNLWDLGFEGRDSSWHVILNTSAFMMAAKTGQTDFTAVTDTTGLDWKYDKSDGNPDSTAIGSWFSINDTDTIYSKEVYIIDRGLTHLGIYRGFKKIIIEKVSTRQYKLKYADLDGANEYEIIIDKDPSVNYTYFSFEGEGSQLVLEPQTVDWDLLFTQYTTLLYTSEGDPYPYLLNGVLINYGQVEVALDSTKSYESIDLTHALSLDFSYHKDAIGYEWKYLEGDPTGGGGYYYKVRPNDEYPNWTYVIRNRNGVMFKMKFTRFYSDTGDKGYPTFVFKVL